MSTERVCLCDPTRSDGTEVIQSAADLLEQNGLIVRDVRVDQGEFSVEAPNEPDTLAELCSFLHQFGLRFRHTTGTKE